MTESVVVSTKYVVGRSAEYGKWVRVLEVRDVHCWLVVKRNKARRVCVAKKTASPGLLEEDVANKMGCLWPVAAKSVQAQLVLTAMSASEPHERLHERMLVPANVVRGRFLVPALYGEECEPQCFQCALVPE